MSIKTKDDIKELLYSILASNLRKTSPALILEIYAMPSPQYHPTFSQIIGYLAQLTEETVVVWEQAIREVTEECITRGGLNQAL